MQKQLNHQRDFEALEMRYQNPSPGIHMAYFTGREEFGFKVCYHCRMASERIKTKGLLKFYPN